MTDDVDQNGKHLPARSSPDTAEAPGPLSRAYGPAYGPEPEWEGEEEGAIDFRRYLAAVVRYRWLVLLIVGLGAAVGYGGSRLIAPEYESQLTLWIETTSTTDASRGPIRSSELLQSHGWIELLRSYIVLDSVVQDLRLYLEPRSSIDSAVLADLRVQRPVRPGGYRLTVDEGSRSFTLETEDGEVLQRGAPGDSIGASVGLAWVPSADRLVPGRTVEFEISRPRDVARRLAETLQARMDAQGNFLRLTLRGGEPQRLSATLNAVGQRYVDVAAFLKGAAMRERTRILDEQLEYASTQLQEAETALENFRISTVTLPSEPSSPLTPGVEMTTSPAYANFFEMRVEREQIRRDRAAIERALESAGDSGIIVGALEGIGAVQGSSELMSALSELSSKRAEMRALRYQYAEEFPLVRELAEEIRTLEGQTIPGLARSLISELSARASELERLIDEASSELREIPPRSIEEARLERRMQSASNLYTNLLNRYEEARLAAASSMADVRVLDSAVVPQRPVNDNVRMRVIFLAIVCGLGLGLGTAVVLDRGDARLRYPEEITEGLGLPILGTVPHLPKGNGRATGQDASHVVEALRGVRLNLMHAYGAAGPVLITISSPASQEGKSFLSSNLALSFADLGWRTLLVDGDIRRGVLHRLFDRDRKPGLVDYLGDEATEEDVIRATDNPVLHLLPCGSRRSLGPELLHSKQMQSLFARLRSEYDVVLVDSPPLAAGVDALVLGTLTGSMMLVLRTGSSNRAITEAKLDIMHRLPMRVLGAVMNDVPARGMYRYYSYYSNYLPGYEAEDEEPSEAGYEIISGPREPADG